MRRWTLSISISLNIYNYILWLWTFYWLGNCSLCNTCILGEMEMASPVRLQRWLLTDEVSRLRSVSALSEDNCIPGIKLDKVCSMWTLETVTVCQMTNLWKRCWIKNYTVNKFLRTRWLKYENVLKESIITFQTNLLRLIKAILEKFLTSTALLEDHNMRLE